MHRIFSIAWILILLAAVSQNASASRADMVQTAFETAITSRAVFSTYGKINGLVPLSDGRVLASGRFTSLGGQSAPRSLAILTLSGTLDSSFQADPALQVEEITAAAIQADGKIVIGGFFKKLPNLSTYYLLRLNANGTLDPDFDDWTVNARVNAILIDGSKIVLGGQFSTPTPFIARLSVDGSADPTFNGLGSGPNGMVRSIVKQSSGMYILAGAFSSINGTSQAGLARLTTTGALDAAFVPGGYKSSHHVTVLKDNSVVVGVEDSCGEDVFTWYTADGTPRATPETSPNLLQSITALLPLPDGGFLIGGWYTAVCFGSSPTSHEGQVWRYGADGSYKTMTSFGNEADIFALAYRSDGRVVVGGQGRPETADQINLFNGLALLDLANSGLEKVSAFHPLVGDEAQINSLSRYTDGKVLVAGDFSFVNGAPRFGLARLLPSGYLDSSFHPFAEQPGGWSNAALALPDGRALAGFASNSLVLLGQDGATEADLSAINDYAQVRVLSLQSDGKVLVGSSGTQDLRRLKADFSMMDETFANGDAYGDIYTLAEQPDHKILAAGNFSQYSGLPVPGLVRLNSNGGVDGTFNPPVFMLDEYNTASLYSVWPLLDGSVLVGGNFTTVGGSSHPALVRLTGTGALDSSLTSPASFHTVKSICRMDDGTIWAGGIENTYLRQPQLMHLLSTGVPDISTQTVYRGAHSGGSVNALLCDGTNLLWSGGTFSLVNDGAAYGIVIHVPVKMAFYLPLVRLDGSE